MKTFFKHLGIAAIVALAGVSFSASAWWGGPAGYGGNNGMMDSWTNMFGDGSGDFDMGMSGGGSGRGYGRGYGQGYGRGYGAPQGYGYGAPGGYGGPYGGMGQPYGAPHGGGYRAPYGGMPYGVPQQPPAVRQMPAQPQQ
jgi:hypothetical protein